MQTKAQLNRQKDGYRRENEMVDYYLSNGFKVLGYKNCDDMNMISFFLPFEIALKKVFGSWNSLAELVRSNTVEMLRLSKDGELEVLEVKTKADIKKDKASHKFRFDCQPEQIEKCERVLEKGVAVIWVFYIETYNKYIEVPFGELHFSPKQCKVKLPEKYRDLNLWNVKE